MSNIAIITARGGSKRIPRKNIRDFCGKPIIAYSIDAALKSGIFVEVMVSTDDKEIAEISKEYGAEVPFFRSAATSDDYATTMDVLREVVDTYKGMGKTFDYMCCLYPTAPFVTAEKLKSGYELLLSNACEMVIPVVEYDCPPQWGATVSADGRLTYCHPELIKERSQDLEPLYHDVGQFYWYDVNKCFATNKEVFDTSTIIIPRSEAQDIDNEADWMMAEMKYKLLTTK